MERKYSKLGTDLFYCEGCGQPIAPDDEVIVCSDCGAIFCRECVEARELDRHVCNDTDEFEPESP